MNQKTAAIASGVLAVALITGCSGSRTYEYKASGTVAGQQVEYDCPGGDLAMDSVAFVAGKGGGGKGGKSKSKTSTGKKKAASSGNGGSASNDQAQSTPKNKGVKLSKKPDSPEKIKKLPKRPGPKPKGCKNEYEIYVLDKRGNLYEQDVRKVDYDKCLRARVPFGQRAKLFPLCTKG